MATIWVPSRIAGPGAANSASSRATAPRPEALEPSIRTRRARGTRRASAASTPWDPVPCRTTSVLAHTGQTPATGSSRPQWWQASRVGAECCTRATSQSGHRAIHPHSRQSAISEKPRRLASTTAFSPRIAASCSAAARGRETGPAPCVRMSTISTAGSREPSARTGSVSRRSAFQASGRGVALPNTTAAPAARARLAATWRAS